jgi:hypothetical protein
MGERWLRGGALDSQGISRHQITPIILTKMTVKPELPYDNRPIFGVVSQEPKLYSKIGGSSRTTGYDALVVNTAEGLHSGKTGNRIIVMTPSISEPMEGSTAVDSPASTLAEHRGTKSHCCGLSSLKTRPVMSVQNVQRLGLRVLGPS